MRKLRHTEGKQISQGYRTSYWWRRIQTQTFRYPTHTFNHYCHASLSYGFENVSRVFPLKNYVLALGPLQTWEGKGSGVRGKGQETGELRGGGGSDAAGSETYSLKEP